MALSAIEQLALWGPPILVLLLTAAYYFRWGKEAEEKEVHDGRQVSGGES